MRMGHERLTRGLLLRLAFLLVVAGLSLHVYLETRRRAAPEVPPLSPQLPGRPAPGGSSTQDLNQMSKLSTGGAEEAERRRRRISYVRSPRRGVLAGTGAVGTSTHSGRKVTFHLLPFEPNTPLLLLPPPTSGSASPRLAAVLEDSCYPTLKQRVSEELFTPAERISRSGTPGGVETELSLLNTDV